MARWFLLHPDVARRVTGCGLSASSPSILVTLSSDEEVFPAEPGFSEARLRLRRRRLPFAAPPASADFRPNKSSENVLARRRMNQWGFQAKRHTIDNIAYF
ncbi:hypothetical protein [Acidimangrovimonas pyrenivorans]|uniref:Uncharacterized protein n=1 Tax=Acidimangrovimonas pyrenivorans TaxID=2030798 RepID=A0ABV7ALQ6_9RHOB